MKIMFFDVELEGHHLEYLHHYYLGALSSPENTFLFVIPDTFNNYKHLFDWPEAENIIFVFLKKEEILNTKKQSLLRTDYECSKLLKKYIELLKPEKVFLTMLIHYIPYLFLKKKIKTDLLGIIYRIYLYEWNEYSLKNKIINLLKFYILSKSHYIKKAFILNDNSSSTYLNRLYNTSKFAYLVDPYIPIQQEFKNLREELNISPSKKIYLHFGALSERKGTLTILESIKLLSQNECKNRVFIFAGKINLDIKNKFYDFVNKLKAHATIIVIDEFINFETIGNLCYTCDVILIPYKSSIQSSGIIGYAAQFGKPVIGPSKGVIGKLIKKYKMGFTLKTISAENLRQTYLLEILPKRYGANYLFNNTISNFINTIFKF